MPASPEAEIDALTERRRELWASGGDPEERASVAGALDQAFDRLRRERAAATHGPQVLILRRARTEQEIEKLAHEDAERRG